jgi:hypothetical protein
MRPTFVDTTEARMPREFERPLVLLRSEGMRKLKVSLRCSEHR